MTKLRFNIAMSLDGYVAGPKQSVENPLGEGGERLHDWLFKLKTFRAIHGDSSGGEAGPNDEVLREAGFSEAEIQALHEEGVIA